MGNCSIRRPRPLLAGLILLCAAAAAGAQVRFTGADLSPSDDLIVRAEVSSPRFGSYGTLFQADLIDGTLDQLTHFPERISLTRGGTALQIQNRYGVFRTEDEFRGIRPIELFPSFVADAAMTAGKVNPIAASPDGRYLSYVARRTTTRGDLVIHDLDTETDHIVSQEVGFDTAAPPVAWSPDSQYLIYAKSGGLYYYSTEQLQEDRVIGEGFRRVGTGTMANVRWGRQENLYIVAESLVYRLDSRELFTRALYSGFLRIGRIVGKLPVDFDANFDRYWISPDGTDILLNKGGESLVLYGLTGTDYNVAGGTVALPFLYLPRNALVTRVLWPQNGVLTVLITSGNAANEGPDGLRREVFRLETDDSGDAEFVQTEDDGVIDLVLSPDEQRTALLTTDGVTVKRYRTWSTDFTIAHSGPTTALWTGAGEIVVAGTRTIELYAGRGRERRLIALSQTDDFGFAPVTGTSDGSSLQIVASAGARTFSRRIDDAVWTEISAAPEVREPQTASRRYRVYFERASGQFSNMVMVRNVSGLGTEPLIQALPARFEPFPERDEAVDLDNFSHGSRIRRREIAIVFNAIDAADGLPTILRVLAEYDVKATFFVNGEFVRRFPDAVTEIANSGHEVGSLFYVYFNMTDTRYQVDGEFVKDGLARAEDEYYQATGRELSLLWHAPYYFVNSTIVDAGAEMGYTYIGRDIDSLDWVTRDTQAATRGLFQPSAELVERILDHKKPGSIVPISVGRPTGDREDYLFQALDLLIDGLVNRGFQVVTVSELMEHAR